MLSGEWKWSRPRERISWIVFIGGVATLIATLALSLSDDDAAFSRRILFVMPLPISMILIGYAPWSMHWLVRIWGVLLFAFALWGVADEVFWVAPPGTGVEAPIAWRAWAFLAFFGLWGLRIAWIPRLELSPYDADGNPSAFEVEYRMRLLPGDQTPDQDPSVVPARIPIPRFDYRYPARMRILEAGPPAVFAVTVLRNAEGAAIWADWQRRMREAGIPFEPCGETPVQRSYREWFMGRAATPSWGRRRVSP